MNISATMLLSLIFCLTAPVLGYSIQLNAPVGYEVKLNTSKMIVWQKKNNDTKDRERREIVYNYIDIPADKRPLGAQSILAADLTQLAGLDKAMKIKGPTFLTEREKQFWKLNTSELKEQRFWQWSGQWAQGPQGPISFAAEKFIPTKDGVIHVRNTATFSRFSSPPKGPQIYEQLFKDLESFQ